MIIAEIGHKKFLLDDIETATQLLKILAKSPQIAETYTGEGFNRIAYIDPEKASVEISIVTDFEVLSFDEAMEKKNVQKKSTTRKPKT